MLPLNANNAISEAVHAYIKKLKDFKAAMTKLFSAISHQPLPDPLMAFIYHLLFNYPFVSLFTFFLCLCN